MMGVYVKDMEMPTSCAKCLEIGWHYVFECVLDEVEHGERKADCPLIPIPPHGDLIDRNKLYEKTAEWEAQALHMVEVTMHDENTTEWKRWSTVLTERNAFKFDVADAPTIIPAKEE